jgi:flagellar basal-body rod modification protein FlgD
MDISASAPIAPASTSAFSTLTKNIDTFLTLLTTQLRNQDPLEPLDTEKFTSQLVQFASVEQSIRTNSHLEALIALQSSQDRSTALDLVGREASVASDKTALRSGSAHWSYILPNAAGAVALTVLDANGRPIARTAGRTEAGRHDFAWDGAVNGGRAPDGVYTLRVDALGADGAAITAEIETTLRVEAAQFGATTLLETAAGAVPIDRVRRISAAQN